MVGLVLPVVAVLFVLGLAAAALGSRLKHPVAVAVNLLLIGFLFYLLNAGGAEPGDSAGNGNPGLLLWIPLLVLGLLLPVQLHFTNGLLMRLGPAPLAAVLLGLAAHQAAGFEIQRIRYRVLREEMLEVIARPDTEPNRRAAEDMLGGLDSIRMSSHFFHMNTYLLFVGWVVIAVIVLRLARELRERKDRTEKA